MYKQIIIARKDLNMSPGKLAAQVSHGSMAFLSWMIRNNSHTELEPEEDGRTLTVIWFKPMDSEIIDQIGRKYHLYV
jgi:peptidyl-tRNA hydrolase